MGSKLFYVFLNPFLVPPEITVCGCIIGFIYYICHADSRVSLTLALVNIQEQVSGYIFKRCLLVICVNEMGFAVLRLWASKYSSRKTQSRGQLYKVR